MNLELDATVFLHKTHQLTDKFKLSVFTGNTKGRRSNNVCIHIEDNNAPKDENHEAGYVGIELNKNQALHLYSFLKAFVEEQDIDIEAED